MIHIDGLTGRQKIIMDLLWNCESMAEAKTLIEALPTQQDQADGLSLMQIAVWETYEQELGELDRYADTAGACIANAMR